jgi:hypothetical protein
MLNVITICIRTVIKCGYYSLSAFEVINILAIESVIYAFRKYKIVLSIVIQITLANHFVMKFLSNILFSFLHYLSIIGVRKIYLKKK